MDRKIIVISSISVLIIAAGLGFYFWYQINDEQKQELDEAAVRSVVMNFGKVLKSVSLLSPTAPQDIEANYRDFVAPETIIQWQANPLKAPGRLTSSPWPDSIEVTSVNRFGRGAYDVSGHVIEMTSAGAIASQVIQIGVVKFQGRWLITGVSFDSPAASESWKTSNSGAVSFRYPENLTAKYISAQEWPPAVKVESGNFSCKETPQEVSSAQEITSLRTIDNRIYCVSVKNEGAAGSVYSSFIYMTAVSDKLISVSFTLRYPSCVNYDEEEKQACANERETFDLDAVADRLVRTVKVGGAAI